MFDVQKFVINWKTHNRSTIICYVSFVVVVTWLKIVAVYWWHSLVHSHTDHFVFVVDCCQSFFFCFFLIFFSQTLFMFICFILFINFSSLSSLPILFFSFLFFSLFQLFRLCFNSEPISIFHTLCVSMYWNQKSKYQTIKNYTAVQHTMLLGM